MRSQRSQRSQTMRKGARFLATELLREPVREGVRDALRDEAVQVRSKERGERRTGRQDWEGQDIDIDDQSGSRRGGSMLSKLGIVAVGLVAILGIRMYMRRKRGGSERQDQFQSGTAGGYDTGESTEYSATEEPVGTVDTDETGTSSTD